MAVKMSTELKNKVLGHFASSPKGPTYSDMMLPGFNSSDPSTWASRKLSVKSDATIPKQEI